MAVLAGFACAWATSFGAPRDRKIAAALAIVLIAVANVGTSLDQMRNDTGPTPDWVAALTWMRGHTPEPLDNGAWARYFPRRDFTGPVRLPPSTYGVGVWWDYGYWVEMLARRIPSSNGTQAGAPETGALFTETSPDAAVQSLRRQGVRYLVLDPSLPVFDLSGRSRFTAMVAWAGRQRSDYIRVLLAAAGGVLRPVVVYLPDYYRSLAVRLYLFDGKAVNPSGALVIAVQHVESIEFPVIRWTRQFPSIEEARKFVADHPGEQLIAGSLNPIFSCVPLEPVDGVRLAFSSDPLPLSPTRVLHAVKVFEVAPIEHASRVW
jgi:hypothetical protein